ncbi:unnamed protein product [Caenorhabditis sp. 36 PRJEB53466]|nr:unnamed protein product [Caenorhabditis sp. 36 PRJEB53466]
MLFLILLFVLFPTVSTSGMLRFQVTASNDCLFRITSDSGIQQLSLPLGDHLSTHFRPQSHLKSLEFTFSVEGLAVPARKHVFQLIHAHGDPQRIVLEFDQTVVLVESEFVCDNGFYGPRCRSQTEKKTSTTISVPSTTSAGPTGSTDSIEGSMSFATLHLAFVVFSVVLLVAVIILVLRSRKSKSLSGKMIQYLENHNNNNCSNPSSIV